MEAFDIVTPSITPLLVGGLIVLAMVGGATWFLVTLLRLRKVRFEVTDHALTIIAPGYGRTIAKTKLKLDEARVVKLSEDPKLQLKGKRRGLGLPGAKLGFYRLASVDKALVFIAKGDTSLYIPTTEDFALLLETPEAAALLEALKA